VPGPDLIRAAYRQAGRPEPRVDAAVWNYDEYANRLGLGVPPGPLPPPA
jgi:hypothetical protein